LGLDYYSTLGYQPSLAFEAAGWLAPLATIVVVLITLFAALPIYCYMTGHSTEGWGSVALVERVVPGWRGKLLILALLGFAATDFVFTKTLSAADAAEHLIYNPAAPWQQALDSAARLADELRPINRHPAWHWLLGYWNRQMVVTVILLLLGFGFWALFRRGFTAAAVRVAAGVVVMYLALTAVILASGLLYLRNHPELVESWWSRLWAGQWHPYRPPMESVNGWVLAGMSLLFLPQLALGLSGLELGLVVMPLVRGKPTDTPHRPSDRVRRARMLLVFSALVMAVYLLSATFVTSLLVPPDAFQTAGLARDRALAYLAHGGSIANGQNADAMNPIFGVWFGSLYDLSTVVMLGLTGASIIIGLQNFVPPFLQHMGMELEWARKTSALYYIFNGINLCVTVFFRASVGAQRSAYAASVLAVITGAAVAAFLNRRRQMAPALAGGLSRTNIIPRPRPRLFVRLTAWYFLGCGVIFFLAMAESVWLQPAGLQIALWFIVAIMVTSLFSRYVRTKELRFHGFRFADNESRFLWESLISLEFPVLIPHRPGWRTIAEREAEIRRWHRLPPDVPVVFLEAYLGDASDFSPLPLVEVADEGGRFIVKITECASVAHTIAAASLELSKVGKPPEIHFGWSEEGSLAANIHFVLFGGGNIPWLVHDLLRRAETNPERRPRVIVG
jgi:hypothetical protein